MSDYTDLCRRLRKYPYLEHESADAIEKLQHTVEAMSADLDQNRVLFETLTKQNKSLFDAALLAAQERDAARRAALEEAAKVCEELRRPAGWSAESGDWVDGTLDCAKAIRALIEEKK